MPGECRCKFILNFSYIIFFFNASFVSVEGDASRSNMAVMEIYLPSGFVVDTETLPTLESSERIKVLYT